MKVMSMQFRYNVLPNADEFDYCILPWLVRYHDGARRGQNGV